MIERAEVMKQINSFGAQHFEVTQAHLDLLRHANMKFTGDGYDGHTEQNGKRPYGNSGPVTHIIHEIFGDEPVFDSNGELPEELEKRYTKLHQEMEQCLQILVQNEKIELGNYISANYFNEWIKVKDLKLEVRDAS